MTEHPALDAPRRRFARLACLVAALVFTGAAPALADQWPSRPIRFVVPYPPGGPLDQVARALAEKLREPLGQPVVVENRPGAGGNIGADLVAKAAPDGYSIVMGAVATHAINPYLYAKMPYDANRDFTPITRVATVPNVLVLNPQTAERLGIRSLRDLIAYARKNPGKLNYGSGGNGSAGHLAGELLEAQAGISMVHIPYGGAAPAQLGLLAGQTDLMFDNLASATPQIRAGKLQAFAVTTPQRSSFFPELPTVAESGLKDFDISTWFGVFAPAGTPRPIVDRLNIEFTRALSAPDIRERLGRMGAEPSPMSPEAFANFVRAEQAKYERIVKASGARIE
ncbi:MAG: tripartite tricarboxylate transporter substrate binding protein [Burkholderiaceae bacterium]|nr:tripartite tricarboxylate transporter substrate binding protein [Burkholderiaceae bacterium]